MGLMGMKLVVWLIFALCPWLGRLGDWMLAWTEGDKRLQVFFVMFVSGLLAVLFLELVRVPNYSY